MKRRRFVAVVLALTLGLFVAGCHIAADKNESSYLGPGAKWTRVEGIALNNHTVAAITGKTPTTKPSGWITKIDIMEAGPSPGGQMTADVNHAFGMDGIQFFPFTISPGTNAVNKQGGIESDVTPEGVKKKVEAKKGITVMEVIQWVLAAVAVLGVGAAFLYYYVPATRPFISGLVAKLPLLGRSEANVKAKVSKEQNTAKKAA